MSDGTPTTPPSSSQPPQLPAQPSQPARPAPPRSGSKLLLGLIIAGIVIALPIAFCGIAAIVGGGSKPTVNKNSFLEIRMSGSVAEAPDNNPFAELFGPQSSPNLLNMRKVIRRVNEDDRIDGVLLVLEPLGVGMATVEEVMGIMDELDESKPMTVMLTGDFVSEPEYMIATTGDEIWMNPEAGMMLNGFVATVTFFRGTLDKLKIDVQAFGFREYKSASEQFTNKKMSKYFRESYDYVISDFYARFLDTIVERRGKVAEGGFMTRDEFEELVDRGGLTAREALDAKIVDKTGYKDEALASLAVRAGQSTEDIHTISFGKYLRAITASGGGVSGDRVALVYGLGPIVSGSQDSPFGDGSMHGPQVAAAIEKAVDDDNVKAIVFRVNSPGGSAVGSDFVWRAIDKARAAEKPVIVSMGDVAGSGGYWISMNADKIVAQPSTITGSIGVVFTKFNLTGFYNWLGVTTDTIQKGENADLFSSFSSLDERDKKRVMSWMEDVYNDFVNKVAQGRGMDPADVEEIAKGRIWTGSQGKDRGLVDELGGLDKAIEIAKAEAGLDEDTPVVLYPRQKSFFEMLAEGDFGVKVPEKQEINVEELIDYVEAEFGVSKVQVIMPEITLH